MKFLTYSSLYLLESMENPSGRELFFNSSCFNSLFAQFIYNLTKGLSSALKFAIPFTDLM